MQGNDKFTIITIVAVLIACVVALIAVLRITFNIAGSSLTNFSLDFTGGDGEQVELEVIDYAFEIDIKDPANPDTNTTTGTLLEDDEEIDYAFIVREVSVFSTNDFYSDPIVIDALKAERQKFSEGTSIDTPLTSFHVEIPKAGFESSVWEGFGADTLLLDGLWRHPNSANFPDSGGLILLCSRQAFATADTRFCGNLDALEEGDLIYLYAGSELFYTYEVEGKKLFSNNLDAIYDSTSEDIIKIVTTPDRTYADQRFVVMGRLLE